MTTLNSGYRQPGRARPRTASSLSTCGAECARSSASNAGSSGGRGAVDHPERVQPDALRRRPGGRVEPPEPAGQVVLGPRDREAAYGEVGVHAREVAPPVVGQPEELEHAQVLPPGVAAQVVEEDDEPLRGRDAGGEALEVIADGAEPRVVEEPRVDALARHALAAAARRLEPPRPREVALILGELLHPLGVQRRGPLGGRAEHHDEPGLRAVTQDRVGRLLGHEVLRRRLAAQRLGGGAGPQREVVVRVRDALEARNVAAPELRLLLGGHRDLRVPGEIVVHGRRAALQRARHEEVRHWPVAPGDLALRRGQGRRERSPR
jgi:hypothetical protein